MDNLLDRFTKLNIYDTNKIIYIQKNIRGYLIRKYILIPSSEYQTKLWRMNQKWYISGKFNECEKYQKKIIEKITKKECYKTNKRFNIITYELHDIKFPMKYEDGYEWTEDLDYRILENNNTYYINLKFISDKGGSQTRSLREVYYLIKYQLENLLKFNNNNTFYINILDGDTSYNSMEYFNYLRDKEEYKNIKENVFIGDMNLYQKYWIKNHYPKNIQQFDK